ncbi:MAG: Fic family protein [Gemmatimonadaceae bacterium]
MAILKHKTTQSKLDWPEVLASSAEITAAISKAVDAGELRPLGLKLYTSNFKDDDETIIKRNLWRVVGLLSRGSVISHRTALEGKPAGDGSVFLVGKSKYYRDLAGLRLRVSKGPPNQEGDLPFLGDLYMASRARAILEAMKPSRGRKGVKRGLTAREMEAVLEREFDSGGERKLNAIRDSAKSLAPLLGAEEEYKALNKLTGVLLGSRQGAVTQPTAIARLAGTPYDSARLELFQRLFAYLQTNPSASRPDAQTGDAWVNVSFFDAYFSNFIEGTEFEVEEARQIVFENKIPKNRPLDAHDVLGTYAVVGNRNMMSRSILADADEHSFIERLRDIHFTILESRRDKRPGEFKETANHAGDTRFVEASLVRGTLGQGFQIARGLSEPFHRAAAVMFIISEVHPFDDGNGRVARAFMNAEFAAAKETRILIPSVYRDDYLTGLRVLTRQYEPKAYVQVLDFAQRFTSSIDWSSYDRVEKALHLANAFETPEMNTRLKIPTPLIQTG